MQVASSWRSGGIQRVLQKAAMGSTRAPLQSRMIVCTSHGALVEAQSHDTRLSDHCEMQCQVEGSHQRSRTTKPGNSVQHHQWQKLLAIDIILEIPEQTTGFSSKTKSLPKAYLVAKLVLKDFVLE